MANNPYKLENMLIRSYSHLRSFELKAYFKATKELNFKGLPNKYSNEAMTRMQGSRYLMRVYNTGTLKFESYYIDTDTMTAEAFALDIMYSVNSCFVEGQYMMFVRYCQPTALIEGLQKIIQIDINAKLERCKNYEPFHGRYAQQAGHSVYIVDRQARLYRIEWQDIKDGKYGKTLVKEYVFNFYVDGRLGLATLNVDNTLSLPNLTVVDLKAKVDKWTIVTRIAKCWLVCGDIDIDGYAIMVSVTEKGYVRSTLKLKLTSNGYTNGGGKMFAGIYSMQKAFVRGRRGIMLAIERDGCCHLISVNYGRLSKLQSIASIVASDIDHAGERVVMSVTATGTKGEFIAGGIGWTKKITIKLK